MKGIDVSRWQDNINWNAVQQALALVNQNGNNPQQAAMNYARQNGIDVNSLLQAFGKR